MFRALMNEVVCGEPREDAKKDAHGFGDEEKDRGMKYTKLARTTPRYIQELIPNAEVKEGSSGEEGERESDDEENRKGSR